MAETDARSNTAATVREHLDHIERGDFVHATLDYAEDAVLEADFTGAVHFDAPRTYRGHEGMRELFAAQAEVFDPFRLEPEEFLDAGNHVLVIARAGGLARRSGVEVMGRFGHLWTVREEKIVHFKEFKDAAEALAVAGLSE